MPASSSACSKRRPAGPTKGLPCRSSWSPGCSPISIILECSAPSPNTVWVASAHRSQPLQEAAASFSCSTLRGGSVSTHRDLKTGTWMFICIHSTRLGSAAGGTRMKHYPRMVDALADGMRLAEAMSLKFASVEFPHGGGKAVIALPTTEIPQGDARRRLLREYGAFINSLGGLYSAAPDMNTTALDMDVVAEVTPYVFCRTEAAGGSGDTAPDTAVGVLHGIRAACRYVFDSDDLSRG